MTQHDEEELLRLTKENNYMLKRIISYISNKTESEFVSNVVANIFANKLENRR